MHTNTRTSFQFLRGANREELCAVAASYARVSWSEVTRLLLEPERVVQVDLTQRGGDVDVDGDVGGDHGDGDAGADGDSDGDHGVGGNHDDANGDRDHGDGDNSSLGIVLANNALVPMAMANAEMHAHPPHQTFDALRDSCVVRESGHVFACGRRPGSSTSTVCRVCRVWLQDTTTPSECGHEMT